MIQKFLKYKFQVLAIILAIIGFTIIRNFEDALFYDPFLRFFKGMFANHALPPVIEWKLYLNLFFRYTLNTLLSLFIIQMLFKNRAFIKFAAILYVLFFFVLILLFFIVLQFFSDQLMVLFYIRRFLIKPLFLLLFVPGFYFQEYEFKKTNS